MGITIAERRSREAWEGASTTPYADDQVAQTLVQARLRKGYTLEEIGVCFGFGKERARQIEVEACAKVLRVMKRLGLEQEFREFLKSRRNDWDGRAERWQDV